MNHGLTIYGLLLISFGAFCLILAVWDPAGLFEQKTARSIIAPTTISLGDGYDIQRIENTHDDALINTDEGGSPAE